MATHKQRQTRYTTLERGQFIGAVRVLAKRWHWSKSAVQRFLDELILRDTIGTVCGTPDGKVYRIVKYEDYAGRATTVGDSSESKGGTAAGHEQELNKKQRTSKPRKKLSDLPPDWTPNESHTAKAASHRIDLTLQAEKFRHYHRSKGSRFLSWDDAFHTWLGNAIDWAKPNGNGHKNGRGAPRTASDGRTLL